MLERFGQTEDSVVAERTARTCLLAPDAVSNYDLPLRLAEQAVTRGSRFPRAAELVRGMADYRRGQLQSAVEWFRKSLGEISTQDKPMTGNWYHRTYAHLFLAMAQHRLGQAEEAAQSLAEARQMMEAQFPKIESGDIGPNWRGWLGCHIVRREAEALIGTDEQ
jgi:hypothetical protein